MPTPYTTLVLAAAALIITPAKATPFGGEVPFKFQTHELETSGGVANLYSRLQRKAEVACTTAGARPMTVRRLEQKCIDQLTDELVANIDHARLSALHERNDDSSRYARD